MKKVFGILFLVLGIALLPDCFTFNFAYMLGRLIAISLIAFLPAFLLLRNKNKNDGNNENKDN